MTRCLDINIRYGRLGHGDSDDQMKPKLVEALIGHRVIDVACGSGDAQTLAITDDDNVWSWGDGDYRRQRRVQGAHEGREPRRARGGQGRVRVTVLCLSNKVGK